MCEQAKTEKPQKVQMMFSFSSQGGSRSGTILNTDQYDIVGVQS